MAIWSILGHVHRLHNEHKLDNLEEISGSSAGSLVAFVYSLGKQDTDKMIEKCFEINMGAFLNIRIKNFLKDYGLIAHDKIRNEISNYCFESTGLRDLTFKEHYELTKIKIHIPALSLDKQINDYFSVDSSPNESIIDAICMSISIPFIFSPYKNHLDGSIIESIPYIPFMDKDPEDVYAVRITYETVQKRFTSLQSYIGYILGIFYILRRESAVTYTTACIDVSNSELFNFKMNKIDYYKLFLRGYSVNVQS